MPPSTPYGNCDIRIVTKKGTPYPPQEIETYDQQ